MISRRIANAFKSDQNIKTFEYLMNEFSTPDEICGPVDLQKLKEGEYIRKTDGFLPKANVAFLDEIWKSGPAILNTLLTIINEHKFHNGSKVETVPLVSLAAASNELPAKNRGLEALFDRFILRVDVAPVSSSKDFFKLIEGNTETLTDEINDKLLTIEDVKSWQNSIDAVELPSNIKDVITAIKQELILKNKDKGEDEDKYYVSDRRWKKIVHILKTSAFLNGRDYVDLMDATIIQYAIWNNESEQKETPQIVQKILAQNGLSCKITVDKLDEKLEDFKKQINKRWFYETNTEKIVTKRNIQCYECVNQDDNSILYASKNYEQNNRVFNANGEEINYNVQQLDLDKGEIIIQDSFYNRSRYTYKIQYTKITKKRTYSPIAQKTNQEIFDKEHYIDLLNEFDETLKQMKTEKSELNENLNKNLFGVTSYSNELLQDFDNSIKLLEDKKLELEKEHTRYYKNEAEILDAKLATGDVILTDGNAYSASEVKTLTDDRRQITIGVVCVIENTPYILKICEDAKNWDDAQKYAKEFVFEQSELYKKNWFVPSKERLIQIKSQSEILNQSLNDLNETIFVDNFWTSSPKDSHGAYYVNFSEESKELDDTTKTHEYKFCLLHKIVME